MNVVKQLDLKSILSLIVLGIFLCIAMATGEPGGSTNTTVGFNGQCQSKPPVSGPVVINISYFEKNGVPIAGGTGTVFVTLQRVINLTNCAQQVDYFTQSFSLDQNGRATISGWNFESNNSGDIVRAEIIIKKSATHSGYRAAKASGYPARTFFFYGAGVRIDDL